MGIWSDLDAELGLVDDISNPIVYGKPVRKKKKESLKKIPNPLQAAEPLPVDTGRLEAWERSSVDQGADMSVAQEVDLDPGGMSEALPTPAQELVDEIGTAPLAMPELGKTVSGYKAVTKDAEDMLGKVRDFALDINPTDDAIRRERGSLAVEEKLRYIDGKGATHQTLESITGELSHAWDAWTEGAWLEGAAFVGTKIAKKSTPIAILSMLGANAARHAFTEKDPENPDRETVSYIARQAGAFMSPENYQKITGEEWITYEDMHLKVDRGLMTPAEAERIRQKQSTFYTAGKNEAENFVKTLAFLGGDFMEVTADLVAASISGLEASNMEPGEKRAKLSEEAEALGLMALEKFANIPIQLMGGAVGVVGSTMLNPGEQISQTPIAGALVTGLQAPAMIKRGEAARRVYKEVAPEHGVWEGAKAAIRVSPEIVRAIAEEVTIEESAVGKTHRRMSDMVNRLGFDPSWIQAFFDIYYGVEKTAQGAQIIFKRSSRESQAKAQIFEDNYGDAKRALSREDTALLDEVLSAGQKDAHYAAFLMGQFGKMKSEGGAVGASKMLRSRKDKTQAETDAIAAELDATAMAIEAQEGIIRSEALENADVLREVVAEREAMVPDVALPEGAVGAFPFPMESSQNFEGGDAHLKRVTDKFKELALENLEKPWRITESGPLEVEPVAPGKMVHMKNFSGPNNTPPFAKFSIQEYEVVEVLSDGTGYLIDVTNRDKPQLRDLWDEWPLRTLEDGRETMFIPYGTVAVDPGGKSLMMDVAREMDYYSRVFKEPFKLSKEERNKAELLVDEFMEDPQTKSELAAMASDWVDPGSKRRTDIDATKAARLEELSGMQPFRKGGRTKLEEEEWTNLMMDSLVESPEVAPTAPTLEPRTPEVPLPEAPPEITLPEAKMDESIMVMENGKWKEKTYGEYGEELTSPSKQALEDLKKKSKALKNRRTKVQSDFKKQYGELANKLTGMMDAPAIRKDPGAMDRVIALMMESKISDPSRLHPQEYIDGKPVNYRDETPQDFLDIVDAQEAATGVPEVLNQFLDEGYPYDAEYQGIAGNEPRKRGDRAGERYKNLAQFLTDANEALPLIWKYKGEPMNTLDFLLDSDLRDVIEGGNFNPEDLSFEMSPDFISDNPGDAMRVHKMGELILAYRKRLAEQGAAFRITDVGPDGQRVHSGETLPSQLVNFVPAIRNVQAGIRIKRKEDGTKTYGKTTMDEQIDQQLADTYGPGKVGEKDDPAVGLDVGRAGTTKQKQFVRYLTGEEGKKAGYHTGDQLIVALDKSVRRQDELHAEMNKNHQYNQRFQGTASLIDAHEMILIDEIWQRLPKSEKGWLTKESIDSVDVELVKKIAKALTKVAAKKDSHMKRFGEVTPKQVQGIISFMKRDPQHFIDDRSWTMLDWSGPRGTRPTEVYRQIPSNQIPGTKVWRYGAVAGKWVPRPQYEHLTNWKEHSFEKLTRGRTAGSMREVNNAWKGMHTVAAPSFFFNLLVGTAELNLKDGVQVVGPGSTMAIMSKVLSGKAAKDPGHTGQSYRGMRGVGELPEASYGLEYHSPGNDRIIQDAFNTMSTRLNKGDSYPVALKKALIQLGRDTRQYEMPEGHRSKIKVWKEEWKEEARLAQGVGVGPVPLFLKRFLSSAKDSVIMSGEILGGFGKLAHFATKLDQGFKVASMERRVDALARSRTGEYEANRRAIFEDRELVERLADDAASANVSYHDLPRISKWLGPTGMAPFFNYMASASKKMLAFPTQNPWAYQMYSEGMKLHKEGLFGSIEPNREEKTNRAMWEVMQMIPDEVWAKVPALFSGEETSGTLIDNFDLSGRSPSGKVLRFTYGSPFQQGLMKALFNFQDEKKLEQVLKGGAVVAQPMTGLGGALLNVTQAKGPYGEDLTGYDGWETAARKLGYVGKAILPTYIHWLFTAKLRAEMPENDGLDPRTKMTLGEIEAAAAGIPIRGARWIMNKADKLETAYTRHLSEIDNDANLSKIQKEENKEVLKQNYHKVQIPWIRGSF